MKTVCPINPLAHVMTFRKPRSVQPHDRIANFKARILDRANHPVIGASAAEGDEMRAGFQDAIDLAPDFRAAGYVATIPNFPHEAARSPSERAILAVLCWCCVLSTKS